MPHQNSVFGDVLKFVPWDVLDQAVERHGEAERDRGFTPKTHLIAMLYAQIAGTKSLRHLVSELNSHASRLYHLGATPVARTTLSDANHDRSAAVFADLLTAMIKRTHRGLRRALDLNELTLLIDSTSLRLNELSQWARFSVKAYGAKLHLVYDPDADCPTYAAITTAVVNDVSMVGGIKITPGATYVFDLGYYSYAWWAAIDTAESHFVTRLKVNTALAVTQTRPVPEDGPVLSDRIGWLPKRLANNRRNPYQKQVREVQVKLDTGKVLRIVTNNLATSAETIANLYKRRWAIELFFRWVKQSLRITRFIGNSENAVRIQVITALIAFLLLRLAQTVQTAITSSLEFARLVSAHLMQHRPLAHLLAPPPKHATVLGQTLLPGL